MHPECLSNVSGRYAACRCIGSSPVRTWHCSFGAGLLPAASSQTADTDGRAPDNKWVVCRTLLTDEELVEDMLAGSGDHNIAGILRAWQCLVPQGHRVDF